MAVWGNPKIEYKKGAQVIVSRDDYLRILKYWGKPLGKVQLTYKDLEKQLKASIEWEKKAAEEINAERIAEAKRLEEVRAEKKKEQEAFEKKQADMKAKHEAEMKKLNAERLSKAQKEKSNRYFSSWKFKLIPWWYKILSVSS